MSSQPPPTLTPYGAVTDAGGRRPANEDSILTRPPVFCVADGMGGHQRGSMASGAVVAAFDALAAGLDAGESDVSAEDVADAVHDAQARIRAELGLSEPESDDSMTAGSTAAGVVLTRADGRLCWLVFNVGDSRIYRLSGGRLTQISVDHSVVQEMISSGEIDADAARTHPMRNMITRAVGSGLPVTPDFWLLSAVPGDRLLLCSDGLINEVDEAEIAVVLGEVANPQDSAQALVARATKDRARDNVSVIVIDVAQDHAAVEVTLPRLAGAYDPDDTMPRNGAAKAPLL